MGEKKSVKLANRKTVPIVLQKKEGELKFSLCVLIMIFDNNGWVIKTYYHHYKLLLAHADDVIWKLGKRWSNKLVQTIIRPTVNNSQ